MTFRYEPFELPEDFSPTEYDCICGWARQNFGHGMFCIFEFITYYIPPSFYCHNIPVQSKLLLRNLTNSFLFCFRFFNFLYKKPGINV